MDIPTKEDALHLMLTDIKNLFLWVKSFIKLF